MPIPAPSIRPTHAPPLPDTQPGLGEWVARELADRRLSRRQAATLTATHTQRVSETWVRSLTLGAGHSGRGKARWFANQLTNRILIPDIIGVSFRARLTRAATTAGGIDRTIRALTWPPGLPQPDWRALTTSPTTIPRWQATHLLASLDAHYPLAPTAPAYGRADWTPLPPTLLPASIDRLRVGLWIHAPIWAATPTGWLTHLVNGTMPIPTSLHPTIEHATTIPPLPAPAPDRLGRLLPLPLGVPLPVIDLDTVPVLDVPIGAWLSARRTRAGLTIPDLAARLSASDYPLTATHVALVEMGWLTPSPLETQTLAILAERLTAEPGRLLDASQRRWLDEWRPRVGFTEHEAALHCQLVPPNSPYTTTVTTWRAVLTSRRPAHWPTIQTLTAL